VLVATTVNDCKETILIESLEADHRRMKSETVRNLDDLTLRNGQLWSGAIIRLVTVWDDGIEAVVTTGEFNHDENPVRVFLNAGALQGLSGQDRGRSAQDEWQRCPDANAVQSTRDEVPTGTATT
jgi:hypothetical protein